MKTSKKIWAITLSVLILFSLSACGCRHEWTDPSCEEDGFCVKCGEINIEAWGHDYYEGYCSHCGQKDPDFVDLNDFGFYNMYGMNIWVEIRSYSLSERKVHCGSVYGGCWSYKINENSYQVEQLGLDDLKTGNVEPEPGGHITFRKISNDVLDGENGDWTILERDVSYNNDAVVLKTKLGDNERWLVPADLLDFDTVQRVERNGEKYTQVYFK